jgi:glyoxylase-like metal-dependent hydrolase (beta-lactamase superfamily II)
MNMLCLPVGPLQANCYLLWDDEHRACAVDPGGEPQRLAETVAGKGLALEAILVTHGHFDHVEAVADLSVATGAKVYCSAAAVGILGGSEGCSATGLPISAVATEAIEIVRDGSEIRVGSLTVTALATPGHTPGDVTYEIDGALFCGDLLFRGSVGRTDFPGGDFGVLLDSVARLVATYPEETRVYPGHMEATSLGHELKYNPFLSGLASGG